MWTLLEIYIKCVHLSKSDIKSVLLAALFIFGIFSNIFSILVPGFKKLPILNIGIVWSIPPLIGDYKVGISTPYTATNPLTWVDDQPIGSTPPPSPPWVSPWSHPWPSQRHPPKKFRSFASLCQPFLGGTGDLQQTRENTTEVQKFHFCFGVQFFFDVFFRVWHVLFFV